MDVAGDFVNVLIDVLLCVFIGGEVDVLAGRLRLSFDKLWPVLLVAAEEKQNPYEIGRILWKPWNIHLNLIVLGSIPF